MTEKHEDGLEEKEMIETYILEELYQALMKIKPLVAVLVKMPKAKIDWSAHAQNIADFCEHYKNEDELTSDQVRSTYEIFAPLIAHFQKYIQDLSPDFAFSQTYEEAYAQLQARYEADFEAVPARYEKREVIIAQMKQDLTAEHQFYAELKGLLDLHTLISDAEEQVENAQTTVLEPLIAAAVNLPDSLAPLKGKLATLFEIESLGWNISDMPRLSSTRRKLEDYILKLAQEGPLAFVETSDSELPN